MKKKKRFQEIHRPDALSLDALPNYIWQTTLILTDT